MKERSKEIIVGQFLEGINQATGGSRHMIHHHQDSRWFNILAILETVSKTCVSNVVDPMLTPPPEYTKKKNEILGIKPEKPTETTDLIV